MKQQSFFDVAGKVVVVTGAGSGLGEGYALAFAREKCTVVCVGRNKENLDRVVATIEKEGGTGVSASVDVTDAAAVETFVGEILEKYGKIDVLVNNAGTEIVSPFLEVTPEQFDTIMGVNIRGVYFMGQAVAKGMKDRGGKIINIGSLGSYIGLEESSVYCTSKGAVVQLTKTLAVELAKYNIQVNAIAPGYFVTPMTQPFYDDGDHRSWIEGRIPAGRWGTNEDLGGPAIFLASSASNYVTGQVIIVDGGWLAS